MSILATINAWLTNNNGYTSDGKLWWVKAIEYLGYIDSTTGRTMVRFDFNPNTDWNVQFEGPRINEFLAAAQPLVAYKRTFGHYFLVDGKLASTYTIKDPKWYGTRTLDQSADPYGNPSIQGYGNIFDTTNLFTYLETPKPISASIHLALASPAELLVTDPQGRKLGKDPVTDTVYNEIPGGAYSNEGPIVSSDTPLDPAAFHYSKIVSITEPITGHYDVKVIGTDSESYALNLLIYDQSGESKVVTVAGTITGGNIQTYDLAYSAMNLHESSIARVVVIDIKPGSFPNSINLNSKGVIPVAILSDTFFNAQDVVIDSVLFAGAKPLRSKHEDIDKDGDLDLVLHFNTQTLRLIPTSTEAILTGRLMDGLLIKGVDSVRIVQEVAKQTILEKLFRSISQFVSSLAAVIGVMVTQ